MQRRHFTFTLLLSVLFVPVVIGQQPAEQRKPGDIRFEPFKFAIQGNTIEGELGRLVVKETVRRRIRS